MMDDETLVEVGYTSSSITISAVVACVLSFSCAIVFCFALCVCCGGSEGEDWVQGETFLDDLLQMQIISTIQRIDGLVKEEMHIRMRLMEEGDKNSQKLQKRLQYVSAKLEKVQRRLEVLRCEAEEEAVRHGASSNNDDIPTEQETRRRELISENMTCFTVNDKVSTNNKRSEEAVDAGGCETLEDTGCDGCQECDLECSICLGDYQVGDEVMKSKQGLCTHQFHKNCIMIWLRKHSHCPLCRTRILEKTADIV